MRSWPRGAYMSMRSCLRPIDLLTITVPHLSQVIRVMPSLPSQPIINWRQLGQYIFLERHTKFSCGTYLTPFLSTCVYAISRYDLRLQISDYKYRNLLFCLRFPAVFCRMTTVLAFHPAIRLFKKQAVIDYAAYRAFYVICIHNLVLHLR